MTHVSVQKTAVKFRIQHNLSGGKGKSIKFNWSREAHLRNKRTFNLHMQILHHFQILLEDVKLVKFHIGKLSFNLKKDGHHGTSRRMENLQKKQTCPIIWRSIPRLGGKRPRLDKERNASCEKQLADIRNQGSVQLPPTSQMYHTTDMWYSNNSIFDELSVMQKHDDDFVPWDFPETLSFPDIILDQDVPLDDLRITEAATSMSWNSISNQSLVISTDVVPHTTVVSGISRPPTSGSHTMSTEPEFPDLRSIPGSLPQTLQQEMSTQSELPHCQQLIQSNDRTFARMGIGCRERTEIRPQELIAAGNYQTNCEFQPAIHLSATDSNQLALHTATPLHKWHNGQQCSVWCEQCK